MSSEATIRKSNLSWPAQMHSQHSHMRMKLFGCYLFVWQTKKHMQFSRYEKPLRLDVLLAAHETQQAEDSNVIGSWKPERMAYEVQKWWISCICMAYEVGVC